MILICLSYVAVSAPCSLVITCWEHANLLVFLSVVFSCGFVTFPMWCPGSGVVIELSIPDLWLPKYKYYEMIDIFDTISLTILNLLSTRLITDISSLRARKIWTRGFNYVMSSHDDTCQKMTPLHIKSRFMSSALNIAELFFFKLECVFF